jgi:hypothetical protein
MQVVSHVVGCEPSRDVEQRLWVVAALLLSLQLGALVARELIDNIAPGGRVVVMRSRHWYILQTPRG